MSLINHWWQVQESPAVSFSWMKTEYPLNLFLKCRKRWINWIMKEHCSHELLWPLFYIYFSGKLLPVCHSKISTINSTAPSLYFGGGGVYLCGAQLFYQTVICKRALLVFCLWWRTSWLILQCASLSNINLPVMLTQMFSISLSKYS